MYIYIWKNRSLHVNGILPTLLYTALLAKSSELAKKNWGFFLTSKKEMERSNKGIAKNSKNGMFHSKNTSVKFKSIVGSEISYSLPLSEEQYPF